MKLLNSLFLAASLTSLLLLAPSSGLSHCQVPCGIFSDQHRFEGMLEDQTTIAKAGVQIAELVAGMKEGGSNALDTNQVARWVTVKEEHCQKIQDTIAAYFMAQRIKPGEGEEETAAYTEKLVAAHVVMRAAMKAKQDPSEEVAAALKEAILDFYRAYEGKEPQLEH
ncbi:MAG: superoxide dismutase [Ni] [Verrucomicrobiota bacterium]